MIILEDLYIKITNKQYIDSAINMEKTIRVYKLSAICRDMFCSGRILEANYTYYVIHNSNMEDRMEK